MTRLSSRNDALSLMDGLSPGLVELEQSLELQRRAARVGFDWPGPTPVLEKLLEEIEEVQEAMAAENEAHVEEELGDLLFAVVNLARLLCIDPAAALGRANAKFERRFRALEIAAGDRAALSAMTLEEMESLWTRVKEADGPAAHE